MVLDLLSLAVPLLVLVLCGHFCACWCFFLGYDCPPSMDSHSKARRGRGSVCLEYACSCLPYNRFWIPLLLLAKVCVKPYLLIDDSSFIYYVLTSQG